MEKPGDGGRLVSQCGLTTLPRLIRTTKASNGLKRGRETSSVASMSAEGRRVVPVKAAPPSGLQAVEDCGSCQAAACQEEPPMAFPSAGYADVQSQAPEPVRIP